MGNKSSNEYKYIDWYKELKGEDAISKKPLDNGKVYKWKDVTTGTLYFIEKNVYNLIVKAAEKHMKGLKDIDELSDYICGRQLEIIKGKISDNNEWTIFPELPYVYKDSTGAEKVTNHRISDQVSIRTGILCAVLGYDEDIRRQGISYRITNDKACDELKVIDLALAGDKNCKITSPLQFDLVKGGAVKIKDYYLETNKIQNIRGASIKLTKVNNEIIPRYMKEYFCPESIIYNGGGNILALVPRGKGEEVARAIENKYEGECVTAQSVAGSLESNLDEVIGAEYKKTMSKLTQGLTRRQMAKFEYDMDNDPEDVAKLGEGKRIVGGDVICQHCGIREAHYAYSGDKLCASCYARTVEGRKGRSIYAEKFKNHWSLKGMTKNMAPCNTMDDIGKASDQKGYVAVMYGDGNNMGGIVQKIESLPQMRCFSDKTEKAVDSAVYDALGEVKDNPVCEIIAVGGDDIFMILPSSYAVNVGISIGRSFDNYFRNKSTGDYGATMSLGILISHFNTPIQYMTDMAEQLLASAKKRARSIKKENEANKGNASDKANMPGGTMDILSAENDSSIGSSLSIVRKVEKTSSKEERYMTLRPYTWEEAESMRDCIAKLSDISFRGKAYAYSDACAKMSRTESELFYMYDTSKMAAPSGRGIDKCKYVNDCISGIAKTFNIKNAGKMFFEKEKDNGKLYSPWPDITELWDYMKDSVETSSKNKGGE